MRKRSEDHWSFPGFKTSVPEMQRVCEIFDRDRDGFIDYYEFIYALYPKKDSYASGNDEEYIEDEVCDVIFI